MPFEDVRWALEELRSEPRRTLYGLAHAYYLGDHRLAFATDKFKTEFGRRLREYADNLCPAVIDSLVDRLQITGFAVGEDDETTKDAWGIWQRNRMDFGSNEVHRESLLKGDGYLVVWPNAFQEATFTPNEADLMTVAYDANTPGKISKAAKFWVDEQRYWRVNLFYPDRIEKYRSKATSQLLQWGENTWKNFWPLSVWDEQLPADQITTGPLTDVVENPYGQVPVFHWPNRRINQHGLSELLDVIPLQDALNKAGADLMVAMETSAFKQRWVTGVDADKLRESIAQGHVKPGADRLWIFSDEMAKLGEFSETNLPNILAVQEAYRSEIARVSGTPLHYLFITRGDFPSGEAMKSAEARFTRKIQDRQIAFGNTWEDVIAFALRIEGHDVKPEDVDALWETASPRSERELLEALVLKQALGVPREQLIRELGYDSDKVDELVKAAEEQAAQDREKEAQVVLPTATGRMRFPGNDV